MLKIVDLVYQAPEHSSKLINHLNLELKPSATFTMITANSLQSITLAKLLNGLLIPTSGKITLDGLNSSFPETHLALRQKIGVIFSNPQAQLIGSTIDEEVIFGLENLALNSTEIEQRLQAALTATDLTGVISTPSRLLTKFEQKKLLLASFLAMHPAVLVLEDFFTNLTQAETVSLQELVQTLQHHYQFTLVNLFSNGQLTPKIGQVIYLPDAQPSLPSKKIEPVLTSSQINQNTTAQSSFSQNSPQSISSSPLQQLDPRLKILMLLLLLGLTIIINQPSILSSWVILLLIISRIARITRHQLRQKLKAATFFILTATLVVLFTTDGNRIHPLLPISITGITGAIIISLKIILLILSSFIFTSTTSSLATAKGITTLLKPFGRSNRLKILANQFGLMLALALRFIPIILEESEVLLKQQTTRAQNLLHKAQGYLSIILPLFINCLEKADELAVAMEARGYHPSFTRSSYRSFKITPQDLFSLGILLGLIIISIVLEAGG